MELSAVTKWHDHSPKSIKENEEVKLLWDFTILTEQTMKFTTGGQTETL